jgi:HK97 family phage major capsid protein
VDKIKALLDELAAVVAEMETMTEGAPEGDDAPMSEEQEASLRSLEQRADKLRERIEFLQRVQAKEVELRAVLERSAPAKVIEATETKETTVEKRHYAVPKSHGPLKAFSGPDASERAYRAGMHIKGYVFGDAEARRWCNDHGVESRAQAGGINSLGGVLTSPELSTEIIRLVEEFGVFPQQAKRVNMNSDTLVYARRTGGLTARPVGENVEVTQSDVTFDNVELNAKIWGVANRIPNSLLEDSVINLADLIAVETAQCLAEAVDNAGFIGDGSANYHSVTGVCTKIVNGGHTKSVVDAAAGNETFDSLELSDFTNVVSRLPLYARRQAKWYISPAGYGSSMLRLAMQSNGNTRADIAGGFDQQFLGFPVVLAHPMVSDLTGTAGEVLALFGDLSQAATYGDRRTVSIKTASERYIEFDQTATFATVRNAIVVHDLGSGTVTGPLVALRAAD